MNKFVETLIATRDDGHDYYPYREQAEYLVRAPSKDDIRTFVDETIEMKFELYATSFPGDLGYGDKAKVGSMSAAYRRNPVYREKSLSAAVEYIFDEDFVFND